MDTHNHQSVYTLIVGLGKTGLSVVAYLTALGEAVVVVDSRDIPPGLNQLKNDYPNVAVYTGKFNTDLFTGAHRIIVSPGVPMATAALQQAKKAGIEICGDIDLFAHEATLPVIGITGSNGKTTVTTLLTQMAIDAGINAVAGGNIGLPVLDLLKKTDDEPATELFVLELSSFQLETLNHLPMQAAVVLNISPDHLDRYENLTAYAYSKQVIYDNAERWVVNADDALAAPEQTEDKNCIAFTLKEPGSGQFGLAEKKGSLQLCYADRALIDVNDIKLKGKHNLQNALAALALGKAMGWPVDSMLSSLKHFTGLAHRTQWVAEINGVNWINDSKATNVGAAIASIKSLAGKQVLLAGGEAKGADFTELAAVIVSHCRAVILLGKDAALIESAIEQAMEAKRMQPVIIKRVVDMHAAVIAASALALVGDNVLLAPACASFDMFNSFEHRGDVFIQEVQQLQAMLAGDETVDTLVSEKGDIG